MNGEGGPPGLGPGGFFLSSFYFGLGFPAD